jgi:hypothetical protein
MNKLTQIIKGYLDNVLKRDIYKAGVNLYEFTFDRIPLASLGGVWYALVIECLNQVDWEALREHFNTKFAGR